jgi:hypothetical protein
MLHNHIVIKHAISSSGATKDGKVAHKKIEIKKKKKNACTELRGRVNTIIRFPKSRCLSPTDRRLAFLSVYINFLIN